MRGASGQPTVVPAVVPTVVLEGTVVRVTYSDDETGFRVVRVRPDPPAQPDLPSRTSTARPPRKRVDEDVVTVVGRFAPVAPGETIRAVGRRENDKRHGDQLRAEIVTVVTPTTAAGIERYLASGIVRGIGKGIARKIVASFGERTIHVLDQSPERLREVPGLGATRAERLASAWRSQRALRELMVVLSSLQISPSTAARIHKRYGERALEVVRRSPYRLALEVWGVGFRSADSIAREVGVSFDDPQRAQAGVLHTLQTLAEEGHTVAPREVVVERAARLLDPDVPSTPARDPPPPDARLVERAAEAIDVLIEARHLVAEPEGVAHRPLAEHEAGIAARLRALLAVTRATRLAGVARAIARFEAGTRITLATAQRAVLELVAEHAVVVVTGGPGVGKTTVVRAILALFEGAKLRTALAAPTGRAAKRMSEATGRDAITLHRLLEVDPRKQRFQRDEKHPLVVDALIVDETSMVDVPLAHALLRATPPGARLVLVGDVDQLPSIGPGAFLRDVIEAQVVPTARLREVFRQAEASRIVAGAHAILRGEEPIPSGPLGAGTNEARGELFVVDRADPVEAAQTIAEIVEARIPRAFGLDPRRDVQVLVPMVRGVVGARALNVELQARLNPASSDGHEVQRGTSVFRVGDRVMQTRNDYERDVFNGDVGFVHAVAPRELAGDAPRVGSDAPAASRAAFEAPNSRATFEAPNSRAAFEVPNDDSDTHPTALTVRMEDGRDVRYAADQLDELTLAYACTVHKAQGSEYPAVVIGLVNAHYVMLARKLLYTAVTRARRLVVIVGSRWALREAVRDARGEERRTTLRRRLRE